MRSSCCRRADLAAIRAGLTELADEHARGDWHIELADEDGQTALERRLTAAHRRGRRRASTSGRSRNDQVLTALRLYLRDAIGELAPRRAACVAGARSSWRAREAAIALPGYTHMQQAMPSSVALWAGGFAAEIRDDARRSARACCGVSGSNPLGLGGRLRHARACRWIARPPRARSASTRTQEPVTAVQLSRGKAEAQLLFEITLLMQDLGRFAADVLLFYTQEFGFVALPDAFTTGSSIMPQKRNPDVFELVRGRTRHRAGVPA